MSLKFIWTLATFFSLLSCFTSQSQKLSVNRKVINDSIRILVDSIFQKQTKADTINVFVEIEDPNMPENWYAMFRVDTTKGELMEATSYIYKGKTKYLTNYYYHNKKLIVTGTTKYEIKDQESDKWRYWERSCAYWNDRIVSSTNTDNEDYDFTIDLNTAYEILKKFTLLYARKKIHFVKGSNIGHFR
jgi:hypothetical protein